MQSIVALFWRIALFRTGPEAVPFSPFLTGSVVVLNIVVSSVAYAVFVENASFLQGLTTAVVSMGVTAALLYSLLWIMRFRQRYLQTLTALVGTDLIVTVIQSIVFPLINAIDASLFNLIGTLLVFWTIGIFGFIFHRALNLHIGFGIMIAFVFFALSVLITQEAVSQV